MRSVCCVFRSSWQAGSANRRRAGLRAPVEDQCGAPLRGLQRYERSSTLVTSNLSFNKWAEILGSERMTGALLDRPTHHVHILEMNGDSYRLKQSKRARARSTAAGKVRSS